MLCFDPVAIDLDGDALPWRQLCTRSRALDALPEEQRMHLLQEASVYAAGKLTEVEARVHFVREIHSQD